MCFKKLFRILFFMAVLTFWTCCSDDGDEQSPAGDNEQESEVAGCDGQACTTDGDCPAGCLCIAGACEDGQGVRYDLVSGDTRLVYRNDTGTFDIYRADGGVVVKKATASVWLNAPDDSGTRLDLSSLAQRDVVEEDGSDNLGDAERLVVTAKNGEGEAQVRWTASAYTADGFYTFVVDLVNSTQNELNFAKVAPITLDGSKGGGLFLGNDPVEHRILENGSYTYLDFLVEIRTGDTEREDYFTSLIPGDFQGASVSSWNHGVKDLQSKASWIAGGLSFESSSPVFNLTYDPTYSLTSADGRNSFSFFSAEAAYQPNPKPVPVGEEFRSEPIYIHPGETNPMEGLEDYATAVKKHLDITLWTERNGGQRVPNGWNSWSGSGSTGGYGTGIDEDLMLESLDVMATEFKDWGIDYFQIDDGYEPYYGDWTWQESRFPNGPRWLSDKIREKGLKPGLWNAALALDPDCKTVEEHPEWLAERSQVGQIFGTGYSLLDLTNPEVKQWLHDLFHTFRQDWNFDWLKLDFNYYSLMTVGTYDPTRTREEMYRDALRIIREEIGDDTFFLAVSVMGIHYGIIDGDRLQLDNQPVWDWEPSLDDEDRGSQQGFKPTVRTSGRRYYLHNRIWINHPDLIIFRSNTRDETWPRVTFEEARSFCTYVGLSGGIVKIGDRLLDMTGEQINVVRQLLPTYPNGARPLDLFTREFPEQWHLHVEGGTDGYEEPYDVLGLINWGLNWDLTKNPFEKMPDQGTAQTFSIDLVEEMGLDASTTYLAYEFWTGEYLGEVSGTFSLEVPSHDSRVVAFRPKVEHPQFLGWNRQITMGATDITAYAWNESEKTISLSTKVAMPTEKAPFTYQMSFSVPAGFSFKSVDISGTSVKDEQSVEKDGAVVVSFVPEATGSVDLVVAFE